MEDQLFSQEARVVKALVYGIVFIALITTSLILFFYLSRRTIIQKEIEKKELEVKHQKEINQASIEVIEEERNRIAQDLHDAISAKLNVVSLTTNVLLETDNQSDDVKESLEHILDVTTRTLESSRKLAHDLLPPVLDKFGLEAAIEELIDDYNQSNRLSIIADLDYLPSFSKNHELHVFRILQELFSNAVKHGNVSAIELHSVIHNGLNIFSYIDNGSGFDYEKAIKNKGLGLQNIQNRAAIIEADLQIESTIGKGTTVKMIWENV